MTEPAHQPLSLPAPADRGSPGGILVACARQSSMPGYEELLVAGDHMHAARLPPGRAGQFRAGRTLLRWALHRSLGVGAQSYLIDTTERGKPILRDAPEVGISISHGGGVVAVAVAPWRSVGIDTEPPVPLRATLVRRCCSWDQQQELAAVSVDRQPSLLARCWTVHEAQAKAAGIGLSRNFTFYPGMLRAESGRSGSMGWKTLPDYEGCAMTVAFGVPDVPPRIELTLLDQIVTSIEPRSAPWRLT
ncbi:4'-phosphopantetheinyl transferase family protein [Streptomyces sp. DT24]|uniref:4'-phosphopantetheinyl transferase family protein n=1 Tax=Streptomyces sp. DT24 TaxID=3416520 RepID=UPI003CE9BF30